eukprot:295604_1
MSNLSLLKRIHRRNRFIVSGYIRKIQPQLTVHNVPTIVPYICLAYYFNGHVVNFHNRNTTAESRNTIRKDSVQNNRQRYTHFMSIRITNPSIINLGQQFQTEIVNEYKKNNVEIDSSLIKPAKFHISLNILSLPTEKELNTFCNALHLFEQWLKIFIFENTTINKHLFFHQIQNNKIFAKVIENNNYLNIFKDIYKEITSSKCDNTNAFSIYVKGANHFNQNVIFLDFENECQIDSATDSMFESNTLNNELVLKFLQTIYQFIGKLCMEYEIKSSSKRWVPHCTIMKISKMKRNQTQKLLHYNEKNLNCNKKVKKNYDMEMLSSVLKKSNVECKIKSLDDDNCQIVNGIDLCAMQGMSNDGYYKSISTLSVDNINIG